MNENSSSWSWQDEAQRLYDTMRPVTYNTASMLSEYRMKREFGFDDDQGDDGSAGVREPRRPSPLAPAGAAALVLS